MNRRRSLRERFEEKHWKKETSGRRQLRKITKWTLITLAGTLLLAVVIAIGFSVLALREAPSVARLDKTDYAQATVVYSNDGEVLTRFFEKNRTWVPLDSIAPVLIDATIATEDQKFYEHSGIDIERTFGAIWYTLSGSRQGGSTITMQLARNAFPELKDDIVLERKIKEWITAIRLEQRYGKNKILEIYLNTVPFVYNAFGIEAAAQTYFNKHAIDLDTLESATLVGMLKGPTLYNPKINPERSRERRNVVLQRLYETGHLAYQEFSSLQERETELDFHPITPENNMAPYFAETVRRQLEEWADAHDYNLYRDGLRVYTTLDTELQRAAKRALTSTLEDLQAVVDVSWSAADPPYFSENADTYSAYRKLVEPFAYFWDERPNMVDELIRSSESFQQLVEEGSSEREAFELLQADQAYVDSLKMEASRLQSGFIAIDPDDGHIKAWVGGRNFAEDKFDHVIQAKRQPGSTFKPFVYATALASGFKPDDKFPDKSYEYFNEVTGQTWKPGNFDSETEDPFTLREALAKSKNTITAQLIMMLGPERVAEYAHRMGIRSEIKPVPAIALGTSEVTLFELASAYTTIADLGTYHEPILITRIENRQGDVIETFESASHQAISPAIAYATLKLMAGVVDEGTGIRIRTQYHATGDLAGKTGTTQRGADGWFMLIHPELVMGSWVGFDLPELTFRTRWWGQGSHTALHVVGRFLNRVDLPDASFETPPGLDTEEESDHLFVTDSRTTLADLLPEKSEALEERRVANSDWTAPPTFGEVITPQEQDRRRVPGEREMRARPSLPLGEAPETPRPFPSPENRPEPGSEVDDNMSETERLNRRERQSSEVSDLLERLRNEDN